MNLNNIATEVIAMLRELPPTQSEKIGKLFLVLGSVGQLLDPSTIAREIYDPEQLLKEIIQTNVELEKNGGNTFQEEFENTVRKAQEAEQKSVGKKRNANKSSK
jgi:hypothetical protein